MWNEPLHTGEWWSYRLHETVKVYLTNNPCNIYLHHRYTWWRNICYNEHWLSNISISNALTALLDPLHNDKYSSMCHWCFLCLFSFFLKVWWGKESILLPRSFGQVGQCSIRPPLFCANQSFFFWQIDRQPDKQTGNLPSMQDTAYNTAMILTTKLHCPRKCPWYCHATTDITMILNGILTWY